MISLLLQAKQLVKLLKNPECKEEHEIERALVLCSAAQLRGVCCLASCSLHASQSARAEIAKQYEALTRHRLVDDIKSTVCGMKEWFSG